MWSRNATWKIHNKYYQSCLIKSYVCSSKQMVYFSRLNVMIIMDLNPIICNQFDFDVTTFITAPNNIDVPSLNAFGITCIIPIARQWARGMEFTCACQFRIIEQELPMPVTVLLGFFVVVCFVYFVVAFCLFVFRGGGGGGGGSKHLLFSPFLSIWYRNFTVPEVWILQRPEPLTIPITLLHNLE